MKMGIPSAGALSKSIKRFMKFTDLVLNLSLDEAERLMHVNVLLQNAIQEGS